MAVAVNDVIQMTDNSHLETAALSAIDSVLGRDFKLTENDIIIQEKRGSLKYPALDIRLEEEDSLKNTKRLLGSHLPFCKSEGGEDMNMANMALV